MGIFYRPKKAPNYLAGLSGSYAVVKGEELGWVVSVYLYRDRILNV